MRPQIYHNQTGVHFLTRKDDLHNHNKVPKLVLSS